MTGCAEGTRPKPRTRWGQVPGSKSAGVARFASSARRCRTALAGATALGLGAIDRAKIVDEDDINQRKGDDDAAATERRVSAAVSTATSPQRRQAEGRWKPYAKLAKQTHGVDPVFATFAAEVLDGRQPESPDDWTTVDAAIAAAIEKIRTDSKR